MSPIKRLCRQSLWIVLGVVVFSVTFALAQEKEDVNDKKPRFKKKVVHITLKKEGHVLASGIPYRVSDETVIIDPMGVKVPLIDLAFPCTATIFYEPNLYDNPMIAKIMVKETDIGARTGWTPPTPE